MMNFGVFQTKTKIRVLLKYQGDNGSVWDHYFVVGNLYRGTKKFKESNFYAVRCETSDIKFVPSYMFEDVSLQAKYEISNLFSKFIELTLIIFSGIFLIIGILIDSYYYLPSIVFSIFYLILKIIKLK